MSRSTRPKLWNICLGNFFEHYDSALFGFLSLFLAPIIFPEHDPVTALILTYAIIPLGMLARPLGALFFGYIGDIYGRSHALFLTLAGMAIVSGCIGLSPTYAQVGVWAPVLFWLGRALQNFLAAGETMGGAIFLLENAPEKRHDILSGFYSASSIGGHVLASFGVFLISFYNVVDIGWRFLYFFGCITAVFACFMRWSSPAKKSSESVLQSISKFRTTVWLHRKPLLFITVGAGFAFANYSMALILMNGFIPLVTSISKVEIMKINTYMLVFDFCALPVFGWLASKISREKLMLASSLGVILLSIPLVLSLEGASLSFVIGVRLIFVVFGVAFFAPFHAWAQQMVPPECRYAVISLGYALGSQLLGGPTAALALWTYQQTGLIASISWYWIFLAGASSLAIILSKQSIRFKERIEI